ncbi:MAG: site-2 protease family protein [Elusimicrobia bacterium]|nr:site-2 protease family protein [Elusimicrobiota bacterium]
MIISVIAVLITFGMVIFLHEFGHFLMCKKLKVRVERFAFGFGPELVGITYGETRFSICAFPLGGFVKPAGETLEDCSGHPDEYFAKSWVERLGIVAAGPIMNYVLAFTLFFGVVYFRGLPEPSKDSIIGEVAQGLPAEKAGLKSEDRVVKIGRESVETWTQMAEVIHKNPEKEITVVFVREGKLQQIQVTPNLDKAANRGLIGITPKFEYKDIGFVGSVKEGLHQCWLWTKYTVTTLASKIYHRERPDLAGPVGIVQMVSRAAHSGLEDLIFLIGLISVAVGFFNILPIPLLDGGHAALYIWEGLSRRKLTLKTLQVANSIGMVFLMSLLLFATYNDLVRIRDTRKAKAEAAADKEKAPDNLKAKPAEPVKVGN